VSISSRFYALLLRSYIPKVKKKIDNFTKIFMHLGSAQVKATSKHVGEIDPWQVINPQQEVLYGLLV